MKSTTTTAVFKKQLSNFLLPKQRFVKKIFKFQIHNCKCPTELENQTTDH